MGASNTNVTRRAVAQQLSGSTAAVSATTLSCTGGQFNVAGTIAASNAIALSGSCAVYAHTRFDATSSTYSDLGNASVYANGQSWVGGGGLCVAGSNTRSSNAVCADGYELSGHNATTCGTSGTSAYLSAGDAAINPNPCAGGSGAHPVPPLSTARPSRTRTRPRSALCREQVERPAPRAAFIPTSSSAGPPSAPGSAPSPSRTRAATTTSSPAVTAT